MSGKNKRRKVVMKVNEMTETDVTTISLVKHAANRSPFKIFKNDKEGTMNIDLKKLFMQKKQAESQVEPTVVVLVGKSEDSDALAKALADKAITVAKSEENDGVVTLAVVEDYNADDVTFLKMSDDIAVGVTGIAKSFSSWSEDESFVSAMATSGFFPGVRVATDVFLDTLGNIMYKAESGTPPTDKVSALTADFGKYVNDLLGTVPVEAFKYEGMVLKKADDTPVDTDSKTDDKTDTAKGDTEDTPEGDTSDTGGDTEGDTPEDDTTPGEGITKSDVTGIVSEQMKTVTDDLSGKIADQVEKTETFMTEMQKSLKAVTDALSGVVSVEPTADPEKGKQQTQKSEGTFDSAMSFPGFD